MGMSASQARLLSLLARQSNLEYQGQQINQARSILSQQCTALYNSLLSMTVPTPPSTTDFQTIVYSGTQGASKFTLGTVTPEAGGTYNVEIKYERNGNALKGGNYMEISSYDEPEYYYGKPASEDYVAKNVTYYEKGDEVQKTEIENGTYNNNTKIMHSVTSKQDGVSTYYYMGEKGFETASSYEDAKKNGQGSVVYIQTTIGKIKENEPDYDWNDNDKGEDFVYGEQKSYTSGGITEAEFRNNDFYFADGSKITLDKCTKQTDANGKTVYILPEGAIRRIPGATSGQQIKNTNYDPNEAQKVGTVGGNPAEAFSQEALGTYYEEAIKAIQNSYPEYKDGGAKGPSAISSDFKIVFKSNQAGEKIPYFVKTAEYDTKAQRSSANGQNRIEVFSLVPNGDYTENIQQEGCKLTFDSSGRITQIGIPVYDPETNELTGYDEIALEAKTDTDNEAYKDAYAQYEYETYLYDQKNKEINAKTEIIQQEDRNLELKLQRLDNERTQITTEIEAVEKVINDNIEASYKTFSG